MRSGADARPVREHDGALDDVLELAHVARPVVLHQQVERLGRELEVRLVVLLAVFLEEVLREQRDVVLPLAQRRQVDVDDVQPVVEVLAEPSVLHHLLQIDSWSRR